MVITSIKPVSEFLAVPPVVFPSEPTIVHYTAALYSYRGMQGLINSLIIASATTVVSVAVGTLMAYSLARFHTGGRHLAFWVLSQRFLPGIAVVLPVFLLYRNVGLNDTYIGMVLIYTVFSLPFTVWTMYAYFRQMPVELENAARVDPLAAPGIVTAAVFAFIYAWTEFFFALILTSRTAFTLPSIFRSFLGFQGAQYGESSALTVISLVPSIALGLLVQRHLVRGLTLGALHE
ncbi:MAG: carbohydrate ABC transporter permease [Bacillati bacterium ANGP1]|uniref:Carbohydrate ABC transporter permease n=1 Tax=Candidatus Segetimicrobium genomatis TaxID=2569760 RepID=A0A537JNG5_9BACT|nr:MAG: carbohydrate ABC transporter permease [Terrabacteria group bacterium ANGP1]